MMMLAQVKGFADRSNCKRSAVKALGQTAKLGVDFKITKITLPGGKRGYRWMALKDDKPEPQTRRAKSDVAPRRPGMSRKTADLYDRAERGIMPPVPNFSAETHAPHRKRLAELVELVKARDLAELKKLKAKIGSYQTSRIMMTRYCEMAIAAIEAQNAKKH